MGKKIFAESQSETEKFVYDRKPAVNYIKIFLFFESDDPAG